MRPFPDVNTGRWQVSVGGGRSAAWARNGRELFYSSATSLMAVTIDPSPGFHVGNPVKLFDLHDMVSDHVGRMYDVAPDAKRFLFVKDTKRSDTAAPPRELVLVLNWFEELKRLAPTN